jgi:hypothetical protein
MMAVENIIKMNDYEKQYRIISMIFEKLFKVKYKSSGVLLFVCVMVNLLCDMVKLTKRCSMYFTT